ncbi:MAG: DUF72 domain-containing protein [Polyangiaceae bacterium]|nr:DUF72 domain-containing protein [Polyangiaceae bacterium]
MKQLGLFGAGPAPDFSAEAALAAALPSAVRFGTSSWTFPGWGGICYPRGTTEEELRERGLELYARYPLFGTVGIDRSYYAPLSVDELSRYAAALPAGFRAVMKAWGRLTTPADPRTGEAWDTYLDPATFTREVADPARRAFGEHVGSIVLEFAPIRRAPPPAAAFAERLDQFLRAVPRDLPLSVELRTASHLSPAYLEVLRAHGVAHVLNSWEAMPSVGEQLALPGVLTAPDHVVTRLLMRPGTRYADRKAQMAPFDRIVDPNPELRQAVIELVRLCEATSRVAYVIVNNKAEGCSPLTIAALAERLAARDSPPDLG